MRSKVTCRCQPQLPRRVVPLPEGSGVLAQPTSFPARKSPPNAKPLGRSPRSADRARKRGGAVGEPVSATWARGQSSAHQPRFRLAVAERDVAQRPLLGDPMSVLRVLQVHALLAKLTAAAQRVRQRRGLAATDARLAPGRSQPSLSSQPRIHIHSTPQSQPGLSFWRAFEPLSSVVRYPPT